MHRALDLGIRLFDTADVYGSGASEAQLGEILHDRRKDVVLATKFGMRIDAERQGGGSHRHVMKSVEGSLRRLRTDWIDLYQLHQPDPATPIEETLRALDDLVRQGKVRYVGCSNFAAWQLVDAQWTARFLGTTSFISCQTEYNLVARGIERELVPAAIAHQVDLLAYCPLAGGFLAGKYQRDAGLPDGSKLAESPAYVERYVTERNWHVLERLRHFALSRGRTLLEVSVAWLASQPGIASILIGASNPEQVKANAEASTMTIPDNELLAITELTATEA